MLSPPLSLSSTNMELYNDTTDEFRMYEFKVRRCDGGGTHEWTDCPLVHPGEKARRRDPRRFRYSSTICPDYRRGGGACPRGDACGMAHGVFESWLHPARYRTVLCRDGARCSRKVCFFAHSHCELRVLVPTTSTSPVFLSPTSTLSPPASPDVENVTRRMEMIELSAGSDGGAPDLDWIEELLS